MHINFAFSFPTTMKQVNTKDDMVQLSLTSRVKGHQTQPHLKGSVNNEYVHVNRV